MERLANKKVLLGLSGGVDSTTAALMLKDKGLEVTGFYFDVLGHNQEGVEAANKIADELHIPLIVKDASSDFKNIVIKDFCEKYIKGMTPNPCVLCNPNIKFKLLKACADEIGAYYIATGHYAKIEKKDNELLEGLNGYFIRRGINDKKDQSYMMYRLGQDILSRLILPLGDVVKKDDTRDLARERGLSNWQQKDSQEICFLDGVNDYVEYLSVHGYEGAKGNFIDGEGNILGTHQGCHRYTIGQRKGLGIALGKPVFVTDIDPVANTVTLDDNSQLFKTRVVSSDNFFVSTSGDLLPRGWESGFSCKAKIRYAAKPSDAVVYPDANGNLITRFTNAQRGPTPGQSVVFYIDEVVIGGGVIV